MALLDDLLGGIMRNAMGGSSGGSAKAALIQAVLAMLLQRGLGGGVQPGGVQPGGMQPRGGGLPGGLDNILGGLTGAGSRPGMGGLGGALGGGLGGLGQIFEQAGMGDQVNSWISTGRNMAVSPDQIGAAFGEERLGQLAEMAGMSRHETADQLSQILPDLVDGLTPRGSLPQGDDLTQDDLGQLVSRVLAGGR
jgi:uncharacterized protein YidB (DUF937 family)